MASQVNHAKNQVLNVKAKLLLIILLEPVYAIVVNDLVLQSEFLTCALVQPRHHRYLTLIILILEPPCVTSYPGHFSVSTSG